MGFNSLMGIMGLPGIPTSADMIGNILSSAGNAINPSLGEIINIFLPEYLSSLDRSSDNLQELRDVSLQTRTYGKIIPEIFGIMKLAGNIIWLSPIREETIQNPSSSNKGGIAPGGSYKKIRASFAVAICKGTVDKLLNVYADEVALDMSNYDIVFYDGNEEQMPNSIMQAFLGNKNVPAFRGICYIIFHEFPLELYGGRIPNFTFEIKRVNYLKLEEEKRVEDLITGVNIIPGSGEFVYDTTIQKKFQVRYTLDGKMIKHEIGSRVNQNNNLGVSDVVASLGQMQETLPQVKWISPVITWFFNSLVASETDIYPACEFNYYVSEPNNWQVGRWNYLNAREIGKDSKNNPNYGGTIDDGAVIRFLDELKKRGFKICFYPMIFADIKDKPWRGHLTDSPANIKKFFYKDYGYREFIFHYANLVKGKIDAFIIGSEFIGLTKVRDNKDNYPAIDELIKIADEVRYILGSDVKITYAADWSEYHHTGEGWYNLDKLWAHPNIDMIGIDAYFPLTNKPHSVYDIEEIKKGWYSGEGYEYYYLDKNKTIKEPLKKQYAWKHIEYFWNNYHYNPDQEVTLWKPRMKPIWFTEYGFPSVDCATNSPNIFFSDDSLDSGFPHLSRKYVDFKAQRYALLATEEYWQNSEVVEQKFVWTWDARPYPFFPALKNIWSDSKAWRYGHFLNGKLGVGKLSELLLYLCLLAGLTIADVDVSQVKEDINGFIVDVKKSALQYILHLCDIFFIYAYSEGGKLVFRMLKNADSYDINQGELICYDSGEVYFEEQKKCDNISKPGKIELLYINRANDYKIDSVYVSREQNTKMALTLKTNTVLNRQEALNIVSHMMAEQSIDGKEYTIRLPIKYISILPGDLINMIYNGTKYTIRVLSLSLINENSVEIKGKSAESYVYDEEIGSTSSYNNIVPPTGNFLSKTDFAILDLPYYNAMKSFGKKLLYLAPFANEKDRQWNGCQIMISYDQGANYYPIYTATSQAVVGIVVNPPQKFIDPFNPDYKSEIEIIINQPELVGSISEESWFNMRDNIAAIGKEIIIFQNVVNCGNGQIKISGLLRGRFGTELYCQDHEPGERFILLNQLLAEIPLPRESHNVPLTIKVVSPGETLYDAPEKNVAIEAYLPSCLPVLQYRKQVLNNGDILIAFTPRLTLEPDFYNDYTLPSFSYHVEIYNKNDKIVRQIIVTNESNVIYKVSEQKNDNISNIGDIKKIFFKPGLVIGN